MYYPFFRGKQFELLVISENAELIARNGFVPVVEPVRESLNGLRRTFDVLMNMSARAILVVNPKHGDLANDSDKLSEFVTEYSRDMHIRAGVMLTENMDIELANSVINKNSEMNIALIHAGFSDGSALAEYSQNINNDVQHLFLDAYSGKLYQRHFQNHDRILVKDGFQQRRNSDHPSEEYFSDLHATFRDEGMDGFGDFLVVGDNFTETVGPAYAVAIHITYIDRHADGVMKIFHFLSDRQDTPTDPAGKFAESLQKLVDEVNRSDTRLFRSEAINAFIELHDSGHYPGLGFVKKLSMQHHMEVIADFFDRD